MQNLIMENDVDQIEWLKKGTTPRKKKILMQW